MSNCQFCKEIIDIDAVICPHCGSKEYRGPTFFRSIMTVLSASFLSFLVYQFLFKNILEVYAFTVLTSIGIFLLMYAYCWHKTYWIKKGYYLDILRTVAMVFISIQLILTVANYSSFVKVAKDFFKEEQTLTLEK